MRVLAIIGSPHKGNTHMVVQMVERGMKAVGEVEFSYVFLGEAHLEPCRGCFLCIRRGEHLCPLKDDRARLEQEMLSADGVIFASPNYACNVSSLMKGFIERFAYTGHRPRFFRQHALAVAVSAGPMGIKETLHALSYFGGTGFASVGRFGVAVPPYDLSASARSALNMRVARAAKRFYRAMRNGAGPSPTLGQVVQYSVFKGIHLSGARGALESFPADAEYWRNQGWLAPKRRSFTGARVNPVFAAVGWTMEKVMTLMAPRTL